LDRIIVVHDLGVLYDPRLKFAHISSVMNKGRGALGFIKEFYQSNLMILLLLGPFLFNSC